MKKVFVATIFHDPPKTMQRWFHTELEAIKWLDNRTGVIYPAELIEPDMPVFKGLSEGAQMIAAERSRQITEEGYDAEHDDEHSDGALAWAAVCYAAPRQVYTVEQYGQYAQQTIYRDPWPFDQEFDKRTAIDTINMLPEHRVRMLAKAGALIAAEIDRLLRMEKEK